VDIIDPHLSKVEMKIEEKGEGEYYVLYKPTLYGKHTINIKFGGNHIAKSPFHVNVVSSKKEPIPTKVKAYGPGTNAAVFSF
jgi:filamin